MYVDKENQFDKSLVSIVHYQRLLLVTCNLKMQRTLLCWSYLAHSVLVNTILEVGDVLVDCDLHCKN